MKVLLLVAQIVPALIGLIKSIEEALPEAGFGKDKLEAVRKIIESTYEGAAEIWPTLEKVISAIVTMFNAVGIFKKS